MGVTGATLYDVSGRGNHGTLTNMDPATDWVGSPDGWALDFDGSNDHIHCGTIKNTSQLTLVVVLNEYTNSDTFQYIVSQRNNAAINWGLFIRRSLEASDLARRLTIVGGGDAELKGTTPLQDATHYLVAATICGNEGSLYVNGLLDATGAVNTIANNAVPTLISCRYSTGTTVNTPLNGSLAFVGMSSRAWSSNEIAAWSADPLALLRPRRRWWSLAPSGSAIAAISQYYRRLRSA